MPKWITPDIQPQFPTQLEDLTDLVRRINEALGLPSNGLTQVGVTRTATDGVLRYRVEDVTFRALQAASTGGLGLTPTEIATATDLPPAGESGTTYQIPGIPHPFVKQVVFNLGDSITFGTSMGGTQVVDTWSGRVFNIPRITTVPAGINDASPDDGYIRTTYDATFERQCLVYGFPSAQLYNTDPTNAGTPAPPRDTFAPSDVNTTANTLTVATPANYPAGKWLSFTSTGTLPAPLSVGTVYYSGNVLGSTLQVFTTPRDALTGTNPVDLTTQGTGTHTIAAPNPSWFLAFDRLIGKIRVAPGQQLVFTIFAGTNDIRYNPAKPITGPGSIVQDHLIPFLNKLRTAYPASVAKVLFVTPIVRSTEAETNNRILAFRDHIQANQAALGIDAVFDPGTIVVNGMNIFAANNPALARLVRFQASGVNTATNTITADTVNGDPVWPSSLTGLPIRFYTGRDNAGGVTPALPAPLTPAATYHIGALTSTTFKLFPTYADAMAGTNEVDLTTTGLNDGPAAADCHSACTAYLATDGTHPLVEGQIYLGLGIRTALNTLLAT